MALKLKDKAEHFYPPGFSKVSKVAADQRAPTIEDHLRQIIKQLRADNKALRKELDELKANGTRRKQIPGTQKAAEMTINGVACVNVAWITKQSGLDQSAVSRQLTKLGIKSVTPTHSQWIPKAQAENIQRKYKRHRRRA